MKKGSRDASRAARRRFLKAVPAAVAGGLAGLAPAVRAQDEKGPITGEALACAETIAGIEFSDPDRQQALAGVNRNLAKYARLRGVDIPLDTEPAVTFRPYLPGKRPEGRSTPNARIRIVTPAPAARRQSLEDLAFLPVTALSRLVRKRDVSATELTRMYLARLKRYGPGLNCVVTLTEDLALEQAADADRAIRAGRYKGPLHGIPWGAKDLFATRGIPTSWGAAPYAQRTIDYDATVVERLRQAGAVLVAKLSLGALAQGDNWFRGRTKNPWNGHGASGSSAGPGAATAAGLVGFSLGSETRGSIISPSAANGVVGLRPTYGRVSRYGAMALSWTMDKVGPMCRSVEDCALVFNAIYGPDGRDETVVDAPFAWNPVASLSTLRIGYLRAEFEAPPHAGAGAGGARGRADQGGRGGAAGPGRAGLPTAQQRAQTEARLTILNDALRVFADAGATLQPAELPGTHLAESIDFILSVEAAAAFDDLTRSPEIRDPSLNTWPNTFRTHRYVPAVEYIRAQRARTLLVREMDRFMSSYDLLISPASSSSLGVTNLTGHPALALRAGFHDDAPVAIMLTGGLYEEATLLSAGLAFERRTDWHTRMPRLTRM